MYSSGNGNMKPNSTRYYASIVQKYSAFLYTYKIEETVKKESCTQTPYTINITHKKLFALHVKR